MRPTPYRSLTLFGLFSMADYFVLALAPIPDRIAIFMVAFFGPLLVVGSYALSGVLRNQRNDEICDMALISNSLAGALVTSMLLVQLAIHSTAEKLNPALDKPMFRMFDSVQLGLDVAWDVFISLGTIAFAVAMIRHARFGRVFGYVGGLLSVALLILNLWTFPTPPGNAGLVDLGPIVGLWYAAVSIRAFIVTGRNVEAARAAVA